MEQFSELAIRKLLDLGWDVAEASDDRELPAYFLNRYKWLPKEFLDFIACVDHAVSPDEQAWCVTKGELYGGSDSAFVWNQWELDTLSVASDDSDWQEEITRFWDSHCPFILSVKNGYYSHISIRQGDSRLVAGSEPEFEEVSVVAGNLSDLVRLIDNNDKSISLYV
ncbi:hypothetical protein ACYFX5_13505 [Bremerella sp. T1]|uniref:hypothetical protein n=1 Tax=Bremerella sp. TYQ1 TaxID=3119568 RepID=UPI001CCA44FB|nr:hypothetical protein [Bremerella volcania]UBM34075.1 hypothetical protein LA756_15445 [Bremerella volcania]